VFSTFSPAARRVLRAAEQESRNLNHYYVGVEHLLLGLLDEHDPTIDATLTRRGLELGELRDRVRRALGTGEDRQWEGILLTPRLRTVIELAEGRVGDSRQLEPLDLLLAIEAEGGGTAAMLLAKPPSEKE
jgi:ATP-dependent Clp protease ATP-binding subunit ClpA